MTIVGNPKFLEWHIDGLRNCGYSDVADRLVELCDAAESNNKPVNVDSVEHFGRFISSTSYALEAIDTSVLYITLADDGCVYVRIQRKYTGDTTDMREDDSLRCSKNAKIKFLNNGDVQLHLTFGRRWYVMALVPPDRVPFHVNEFTRKWQQRHE